MGFHEEYTKRELYLKNNISFYKINDLNYTTVKNRTIRNEIT